MSGRTGFGVGSPEIRFEDADRLAEVPGVGEGQRRPSRAGVKQSHSAGLDVPREGTSAQELAWQAFEAVAGRSLHSEIDAWVHGTEDLPLAALLAAAAVEVRADAPPLAAALGLRLSEGPVSGVQVKSVLRGSAAESAGVAAGDELLAVDGWRIRRLDDAAHWVAAGAPFDLLLVRDQRVMTLRVQPAPQPAVTTVTLVPADKPTKAALALKRAWLSG